MARTRFGSIVRTFLRQTADPLRTPSGEPDVHTGTGPAVEPSGQYAPEPDGRPDPGEVVWAWVAYEDDPSQGKDRPVLVIGRDGATLLGLQLSSKDHDRDAADEASYGRYWMDIGSGGWDRERRPSEVRLDRLLRMQESEVRREGAALDQDMFESVVRESRAYHDL